MDYTTQKCFVMRCLEVEHRINEYLKKGYTVTKIKLFGEYNEYAIIVLSRSRHIPCS